MKHMALVMQVPLASNVSPPPEEISPPKKVLEKTLTQFSEKESKLGFSHTQF